jgi:hypothetical protein
VVRDVISDTSIVAVFEALLSAGTELFVCLQTGDRLWVIACLSPGGVVEEMKKNVSKHELIYRHCTSKESTLIMCSFQRRDRIWVRHDRGDRRSPQREKARGGWRFGIIFKSQPQAIWLAEESMGGGLLIARRFCRRVAFSKPTITYAPTSL